VTWHDTTPGNSEIYFKRSLDGGANWTVNKRLTFNAGNSYASALAVDGSKIYTVWFDDTPGNYEIYFKKSFDGGANWRADKRLTNNTGASRYPALAVDGPNIYVVWFDVTPMNLEIYFKQSLNAGVNWTANKRLTNNTGRSEYPALAVDGSNIHVIWQDETPGNLEIYYKKGVLD
jgi:hypothetical protein